MVEQKKNRSHEIRRSAVQSYDNEGRWILSSSAIAKDRTRHDVARGGGGESIPHAIASPVTRRRTLLLSAAIPAVGVLGVASWLVLPDSLAPCPALVILNGDFPARVDEASRLYHAGVAREVWLTNDPQSADSRGDAGTASNIERLTATGVPATAIRIVPGEALGTRRELVAVGVELRRRALPCAIVVTSPAHGARVKVTWWKLVGATPGLLVRHAPGGTYTGWRVIGREAVFTVATLLGIDR